MSYHFKSRGKQQTIVKAANLTFRGKECTTTSLKWIKFHIDSAITILTNYAYFRYYSFLFVLPMQPKPERELEHDRVEPNAGPPSGEPQIF